MAARRTCADGRTAPPEPACAVLIRRRRVPISTWIEPFEGVPMYKYIIRKCAVLAVLACASVSAWADLPDFTQLVEKNAPAVVNVQATNSVENSQGEVDD